MKKKKRNANDLDEMTLDEQLSCFDKYWKTSKILKIKHEGHSYYLHESKYDKYLNEGKIIKGGEIKLVTKNYKEAYMFPLDYVVKNIKEQLSIDEEAEEDEEQDPIEEFGKSLKEEEEDEKIMLLACDSNIFLRILVMFIILAISITLLVFKYVYIGIVGILFLAFIIYGIKKKKGIAYKLYLLLGSKERWSNFFESFETTDHAKKADHASTGGPGNYHSH